MVPMTTVTGVAHFYAGGTHAEQQHSADGGRDADFREFIVAQRGRRLLQRLVRHLPEHTALLSYWLESSGFLMKPK